MKKFLFPFLFLSSSFLFSQVNFTDSDLPIVVINTNSQTIQDTVRISADMGIIYNGQGNRNYMTNPFNHFDGKISIEIRGSTSQQYPKKSYGLETQDSVGLGLDTSLFGMPSENDWILYGAYPDKTLMRNEITYDIFRKMNHYDPRYAYVELVINGQYMGVYSFMEKIKRDPGRLAIPKISPNDTIGDPLSGGYIMKIDKLTGSSSQYFASPYNIKVKYLCHDPEYTELVAVQYNYIRNYITNFENIMNGPNWNNLVTGYNSVIEVNSFIDFMIMQELGRTIDGYRSSSFLYKQKDSKGGLLHAGPMWDFNLSYGNADYCDAFLTTGYQMNFNSICGSFSSAVPFWWNKFLQDTSFTHLLKCRWMYLRNTVLHTDSVNARIDSMKVKLNESQQRNFTQWPILGVYVNWNYFVGNTWQEEIDYMKGWFLQRSQYLDAAWPGYCWNYSVEDNGLYSTVSHQVYPNPANEWFILNVSYPFQVDHATFSLFDIMGKEVLKADDISVNELLVSRNQLPPGVYFYRLIQENKLIAAGKIIFR